MSLPEGTDKKPQQVLPPWDAGKGLNYTDSKTSKPAPNLGLRRSLPHSPFATRAGWEDLSKWEGSTLYPPTAPLDREETSDLVPGKACPSQVCLYHLYLVKCSSVPQVGKDKCQFPLLLPPWTVS